MTFCANSDLTELSGYLQIVLEMALLSTLEDFMCIPMLKISL